ncbi:hypothetical protein [Micromonospora sp. NPDC048830]|uniref:hypothetical protein n=1 Tax=Micromonospora sp. NPDC048830 TaxID=3364257 RepID=UPI00371349E7
MAARLLFKANFLKVHRAAAVVPEIEMELTWGGAVDTVCRQRNAQVLVAGGDGPIVAGEGGTGQSGLTGTVSAVTGLPLDLSYKSSYVT